MIARATDPPLTFHAARDSRVLFLIVFAVPLAIGIVATTKNPNAVAGLPAAALLWLAPQIWFSGFRLVISAEAVEYRTLFQKRSIPLAQIAEAKVAVGLSTESTRRFGPVHLILRSRSPDEQPLHINAKVFPQPALQAVLDAVEQHGGRVLRGGRRRTPA